MYRLAVNVVINIAKPSPIANKAKAHRVVFRVSIDECKKPANKATAAPNGVRKASTAPFQFA